MVHVSCLGEDALEGLESFLAGVLASRNTPVCVPDRATEKSGQLWRIQEEHARRNVPLVSKSPFVPLVQIIGRRPIALEIARTRLSVSQGKH